MSKLKKWPAIVDIYYHIGFTCVSLMTASGIFLVMSILLGLFGIFTLPIYFVMMFFQPNRFVSWINKSFGYNSKDEEDQHAIVYGPHDLARIKVTNPELYEKLTRSY